MKTDRSPLPGPVCSRLIPPSLPASRQAFPQPLFLRPLQLSSSFLLLPLLLLLFLPSACLLFLFSTATLQASFPSLSLLPVPFLSYKASQAQAELFLFRKFLCRQSVTE